MEKVPEEKRQEYIAKLAADLPVLRTMLGLSQAETAELLGMARQTFSKMEVTKSFPWNTFLSLLFIFDQSEKTHDYIRQGGYFPQEIPPYTDQTGGGVLDLLPKDVAERLDSQAVHAIETVVMLEYARCTRTPGETVVKAFDGRVLIPGWNEDVETALKNIRKRNRKPEE